MSPESLRCQTYSFKTDVWSFGVTAWEVITRKDPYEGVEVVSVALEVVNGKVLEHLVFPSDVPESLTTLIQRCWSMDPLKRPNFDDIYEELCRIELELKSF